jgi:hypothetical protein
MTKGCFPDYLEVTVVTRPFRSLRLLVPWEIVLVPHVIAPLLPGPKGGKRQNDM